MSLSSHTQPFGAQAHSQTDLERILGELVLDAVKEEFDAAPAGIDPVVRPSKFADYQVNGALPLSKTLGLQPREIAERIARHLLARRPSQSPRTRNRRCSCAQSTGTACRHFP